MRSALILIATALLSPIAFPADIYVPDDHPMIQDAINAAVDGDTIIVRPGTYVENVDFVGKAITVKSEMGAAVTTINGNQADSVVKFQSGEAMDSVLCGFTLTGGNAAYGAGIFCGFSSPIITNNIISGNTAGVGGGIFDSDSSSAITSNTITGNTARISGGGFYCLHSSPVITHTILWDNGAPTGKEIWIGNPAYPSTLDIEFSDVEGGQSSIHVDSGCTLIWGQGMIDADPLFLDPANGDFHIPFDSPCRSAGDRNAPNLPDIDFEGDPRTGLFAFPDIGADEFHTHFYVNGTVTQGSTATGVIIGWPKTNPVMLISGSGILPTPDPTPFGDFWLMPPWNHRVHFNPMPENGVRIIDRVVSTGLPPGTQIPFQALVGTELSNLWVVTVE